MPAKKSAGKKGTSKASEKRRREAKEDASNKRINTIFRSIDSHEYQESLSQKSSQLDIIGLSSQRSVPDSSAQPPTSSATSFQLTQSQSTSLSDICDRFIIRDEEHFRDTYERYRNICNEIATANPRLLIACLGVLVIDHLKSRGYYADGIFRAMAMQHNEKGHGSIVQAWRSALDGGIISFQSIHDNIGDLTVPIPVDWEEWTMDAEALELIEAQIEGLGLIQMQAILRWSYRCACHLSTKTHFDPSFAMLMYGMRYLARCGYGLDSTIKAMAMEILGRRQSDIARAWDAARGVDAVC